MNNKQIIVSLPVRDLEKSKAFFSALGYRFDPKFSGENSAGIIIAEGSIYVMLSTEAMFKSFIDKPLAQAREANEVVVSLSCQGREELEGLIARATAGGARIPHPLEDHGFMVTQGFEDLDGHLWNLVYMVPPA